MTTIDRRLFSLDPDIYFLNHGSFGACPLPVQAVCQDWQQRLERQPVAFMGRDYDALMDEARAVLASYVGCDDDALIFVPNATVGLNLVARSLALGPGDEILTTDHEYGAMIKMWDFIARRTGARVVQQPIPLPLTSDDALIEALFAGVTERTRILFFSHITSPTALILPAVAICQRARQLGILSIVDGAHAPGQLALDINALGADFYAGNCHKWLCAPKGSGFLFARSEHHDSLEPLVISWGWEPEDSSFVTRNQWMGTRDVAAYLSVPAAIAFQQEHNWDEVRAQCHALAVTAHDEINTLTGCAALSTGSDQWFGQMVSVQLPPGDMQTWKRRLYDEFKVEVPLIAHNERICLRVSIQG